jgi:hypothetical protein
VELLLVVGIIGLIASMTVVAFLQVVVTQRRNTTAQTVKTASSLLDRQWTAVRDQAMKEDIPSSVLPTLQNWASGSSNSAALVRLMWVKMRLKQAFPTNFTEALSPSPLWAMPTYKQALTQAGASGSIPPDPAESSVCLLLALQLGHATTVSEDVLGSATIADSKWSGLSQLVDAWGQPLAFYRYPTANTELDKLNPAATGPGTKARDPLDPTGLLMDPGWNNWTNYNAQQGVYLFDQNVHSVHTGSGNTYTAVSVYMVPVIVSAGPNQNLGIDTPPQSGNALLPDPMSIINQDAANDNIYSYRLRLGARGD